MCVHLRRELGRHHGDSLASFGGLPTETSGVSGMKKSALGTHVTVRASVSRATANAIVDAVFSSIGEALARGEAVAITGFGTASNGCRGPQRHHDL